MRTMMSEFKGMLAGPFALIVAALILLPGLGQASLINQMFMYAPVVNSTTTVGHVMARAQVIGPNGGPILVKVRSSGSAGQSSTVEIEEIGEAYAGGPLDGVYVLSGAAYRDVLRQLTLLRARYPERMVRAEFLPAQQLASGLLLADGSRSPGITLPDHIKTVVVWGRQDRLAPGTDAHIILTAPFQLDAGTALPEDVSSLLMNPDGSIRSLAHGSGVGGDSFNVESFTWRTAFYAQPGSTEQSDKRLDRINDQIFGPIPLALLEQYGWFGTMQDVTDVEGQYGVTSRVLCLRNALGGYLTPGIESSLILTVPTVPFNPNRLGTTPYYELRYLFMPCSDDPAMYRMDFLIDVLWLVGELHLSNTPGGAAIPVGSSVSYEGQDRSGEPTVRVWDYDGDGEADKAILANKITVTDPQTQQEYVVPEQANDGAWQAVYFSSGTRRPDADALADRVPDLWRLADRTLDGRPTGLLTEISEDALRHTDVYIFRESTGELLVEVSGLPEGPYAGRASRIENNAYLWHTLLRGRESVRNNFAAYGTASGSPSPTDEDAFRERSAELGFSSRYQSRDADMPAPGEKLYVVAINRVTGYTGSVRFELGTANSPGGAQQRVPRLELLPPNVKVWAQRLTEIEAGLTAGEQREYLISHEGAHTANDLIVGLYTEWRAADGSPLPNALGQLRGADFGLTGRLAKVRDGQLVPVTAGQALDSSITLEDALAAGSQGAVAEFPIGPGQNLQLLRLPNTETGGNEHYYVNLFGRALNKEVCSHCQYDQAGLHPTLAGRPNHFAPVLVPYYDEAATAVLRHYAQQEGLDVEVGAEHRWALRPEYQFSQLDFTVSRILASYRNPDGLPPLGDWTSRNLLEGRVPLVTHRDELLQVYYQLFLPIESALPGFDHGRRYVIAIGEEEFLIDPDDQRPLAYRYLDILDQLERLTTPGDYLTIRLFLNHDPENLLWEWAFGRDGARVVFEYPGDEIVIKPERRDADDEPELYRIVGGARVYYGFNFPYGATPHSMVMSVNHSGRICAEMHTPKDQCTSISAAGPVQGEGEQIELGRWPEAGASGAHQRRWGLYWEPEVWRTDLAATMKIEVAYWLGDRLIQYSSDPIPGLPETTFEEITLAIESRELIPAATGQQPMRGSDVAMLEAMLWQLGLSPQMPTNTNNQNSGRSGSRINSDRGGTRGWTLNCKGQRANRRDVFYSGWGAGCGVGRVSLEGMVRRYQARNTLDSGVGGNRHALHSGRVVRQQDSNKIDGILGSATLAWLQRDWQRYLAAYARYPRDDVIGYDHAGINDWLDQAVEMWSHGYVVETPTAQQVIVPPTYTEALHLTMLRATDRIGLGATEAPEALTRRQLLRSWKEQESPNHWGLGSPRTDYRITEGSGDEAASMSFNQVQYRFRYGAEPCQAHHDADLNYFDPADNMRGFVIHLASSGRAEAGYAACPGSFNLRFGGNTLAYRALPEGLVGYREGTHFHPVNGAARQVEDIYELLAHAIGGYQGGPELGAGRSWPQMLRSSRYVPVGAVANTFDDSNQAAGICPSCTYAMEVLDRFFGEAHRRTYIWRGGINPAFTTDDEGNQIPHPQAGEAWCFAYGEGEWLAGVTYNQTRDETERHVNNRPRAGDVDRRSACQ